MPPHTMNILRNIKAVIKRYENEIKTGRIAKPGRCEVCGARCKLWWHDEYTRKLITLCGTHYISIKRVRCSICRHAFALIPEFIKKYCRYATDVIGFAVKKLKEKVSCKEIKDELSGIMNSEEREIYIEATTLYRWRANFCDI